MKKLIFTMVGSLIIMLSMGQSEKYMKAMKDKVAAVDTTRDPVALRDLSAAFERIAEAEKTQWLPFYYAALTQVNAALVNSMSVQPDAAITDPMADKAEELLNKAEAISKDNSEIFIVRKLIASTRMIADPMNRYMKYAPAAQEALETAKKLNPENPRVYLLEGQDKFFTPEKYGGSKTEAKKLFEEAAKKFESFRPASEIDPSWGQHSLSYFMGQVKEL